LRIGGGYQSLEEFIQSKAGLKEADKYLETKKDLIKDKLASAIKTRYMSA